MFPHTKVIRKYRLKETKHEWKIFYFDSLLIILIKGCIEIIMKVEDLQKLKLLQLLYNKLKIYKILF